MALRYYANAPATALTNSCSAPATTITVDSVTGLPISYPYTLIIDRGLATEEAVEVTAAAGTTLTVTRGIDSTTAFAHAASASVVHGITARDIREPNAHVNANSGVHGVSGNVVGTEGAQLLANKTAPTPATSDDSQKLATTAFVKAVLLAAHPVGDIVMNTSGTNPGTYLGGTWIAWGSGRVPVGVDTGQTEFDTVEETGGAKTHTLTAAESGVPAHSHDVNVGYSEIGTADWTFGNSASTPRNFRVATSTSTSPSVAQNAASAHNNLQPYITCYMWKRTA